jgi:hypothetical protein
MHESFSDRTVIQPLRFEYSRVLEKSLPDMVA